MVEVMGSYKRGERGRFEKINYKQPQDYQAVL